MRSKVINRSRRAELTERTSTWPLTSDVPRRGADGDRLEVPARHRHVESAGRRRAVPGAEGAARAQLAGPSDCRQPRSTPIVLTHAHLDHCGYLPRLVAQGFRGRVFCTAGHAGSLPDRPAGRRPDPGRRRGERQPPRLLEARAGAAALHRGRRVCARLRSCSRSATTGRCRSPPASRSSSSTPGTCSDRRTRVSASDGRTILFGGDLGRFGRPVLPDPTMVAEADYLLVESTYGNRVHEQDDDGAAARADHQRRPPSAAAGSSSRRSRSAGSKSCSTG